MDKKIKVQKISKRFQQERRAKRREKLLTSGTKTGSRSDILIKDLLSQKKSGSRED